MKIDLAYLRQNIDLEKKYVDFHIIRNFLSILRVAEDVGVNFNEPNTDGECRGDCPKCDKQRSFSLNINSTLFNCFDAKCDLKGSGVIDFASKLFATDSQEACHLLACAYGIQPYIAAFSGASLAKLIESEKEESGKTENYYVLRSDFEALEAKHSELRTEFNRLRNIVYTYMLEQEEENIQGYENGEYEHTLTH